MEVMIENVPLSGAPILIFLFISITTSSPVYILIFASEEQIRSNLEVKLQKRGLSGQG